MIKIDLTQLLAWLKPYLPWLAPLLAALAGVTITCNVIIDGGDIIVTPPEPTPATWGLPLDNIQYISGFFRQQRGIDPPEGHSGVDLVPPNPWEDHLVYAIRDGCTLEASAYQGYGYRAVLQHDDGYSSLYAHLLGFNGIAPGVCINKGDAVGVMDNTGFSTGPHLHLEIKKDGVLIDPLSVLPPITATAVGGEGDGYTDYGLPGDWGPTEPDVLWIDPPLDSALPGEGGHGWEYKPGFLALSSAVRYCVATSDWGDSAGGADWDTVYWVLEVPPSWEDAGLDFYGGCSGSWDSLPIGLSYADFGASGWGGMAQPMFWTYYPDGWRFAHCRAFVNTHYMGTGSYQRQYLLAITNHEVGHCVGLFHGGGGVMESPPSTSVPNAHDLETVRELR